MTYVVTKPCLGTKDRSCVEVCPVDCFYDIRKKEYNEKYGVAVGENSGDDNSGGDEAEDGDARTGMLLIHPDECINCGACETECPVEAIYEDTSVPDDMVEFTKLNEEVTLGMSDDELEETRCTGKL